MSETDVVAFGVASKVYTEKDVRVVKCWEEEEDGEGGGERRGEVEKDSRDEFEETCREGKGKRIHFGWRHKYVL